MLNQILPFQTLLLITPNVNAQVTFLDHATVALHMKSKSCNSSQHVTDLTHCRHANASLSASRLELNSKLSTNVVAEAKKPVFQSQDYNMIAHHQIASVCLQMNQSELVIAVLRQPLVL